MVKTIDEKTKKTIEYCPLVLSFARTIHTYQGQSAGPMDNKFQNPIMRIICDVGSTKFESQNIGLFYTALSRATTIGSIENKRIDSAIYFTQSLDQLRLEKLTTKSDNTEYEMIRKRNSWIKLLLQNNDKQYTDVSNENIDSIFNWAMTTRLPLQAIEKIIN